jgi:hypothetical protein
MQDRKMEPLFFCPAFFCLIVKTMTKAVPAMTNGSPKMLYGK